MDREKRSTINRKEFLLRSTAGVVGIGLSGSVSGSETKRGASKEQHHYRTLGRTGLKVTFVGYGGSRVKEPGVIRRGIDAGINFIDTGRMYDDGRNEEMIGRVIKDVRKNIIVQSKVHQNIQSDKAALEKSIEESLKALRTDYIDIILIRGAGSKKAINNHIVMEAFDKAKKSGKIRFTGFSCHSNQPETMKAAAECKYYDVGMVTYNHAGNFTHSQSGNFSEWDQPALEKEIEKAVTAGIGIVAMKTCSAGPLKEKGQAEATFTAALKWIRKNTNITAVVPGMASYKEIEENIRAML